MGKFLQWVSFYNGSGSRNDYSYGIAVNGSGDVFVTGWADGNSGFLFPDPEWEFVTIKYNAAGVQQWVQIYDYVGSLDRGFAIALDDSSNVYVTGSSYDSGDPVTAATTIKYNSSGTLKWSQRYDGPGSKIYDGCVCIVLDDSANVYVGGLTGPAADGPNLDYLTIKYSRGGAQRWFATYDGPGNSYDVISEIAVDDAHNVYVTGRSRNDDNDPPSFYDEDFATIKYNITGSQQWVSRYNSATNRPDVATGIKLTCQGVYVAGWSSNGTNLDYKWIRYASSDGGQDWVRSYNSGGQDSCTALCVVSVAGAGAIDHIYLTGAASYDYVTKDDTANNSCLDSPFGYPLSVDNRNTFTWSYSLSQNYPNPFNPQTEIFFEIKFSSPVKLTVYDITGKEVLNMINNEYREAGRYSVKLDGTNLASGMYFYRIEAGSFTDSKKMLLIK